MPILSAYLGVSGLADVGYRFYTSAEAAVAARITAGIVDAGDGWYSADATIPATGVSVRWDSTGTTDAKAREYIDNLSDPWTRVVPNGYAAGTAGKVLGDNLNATISSRATPAQVQTELTTYGALKPTIAGRTLDVATGGEAGVDLDNTVGTLAKGTDITGFNDLSAANVQTELTTYGALKPTTAGRTLDVSAGGEAGLDWANIGAPATAQTLSATTIGTATNLTNDPPGVTTLLGRITSTLFTGITSLKEWLGLLAGKQTGNATARTEIRSSGAGSGTYDETTDSQESIRDRGDVAWITGAGGDPWATALPGAYGAGTAGNIIGNNLNATVSSRATPAQVQTELGTYGALKPTIAARTLDVSVGGEAGVDWANIGTPTTVQNLSGTTIKAVTDPVTLTSAYDAAKTAASQASVNAVDDFVDTEVSAIKMVTDKLDTALEIDGAVYRYTTNALEQAPTGGGGPTAAAIADAVWDEAISGHLTAGSTGATLNAAGSAGDPWVTPIPGAYGAGTAGNIIGNNLNATVSSRATQASVDTVGTNVTGIKSKTDGLPADPADASDIAASFTTLNTKVDTIDDFLDTEIAAIKAKTDGLPSDPADASVIAASFASVDTKLNTIDDFLDTEIAAIQTKVNALPTDPADASDIAASFVTVNGKLDAINGSVDTEVGAIKTVTDKLNTALEVDGPVWRYTTNALEQAPTGGGGSDPWAILVPGSYGAGTAGKILGDNLDAKVSTRMPTSSYIAPDNAGIAAIQSKTNNLPADPADASDIATSFITVNTKLDAIDDYVDTEISAIKSKTDALPANPASVSDIPTAIQNADALLKRDMGAVSGEASRSPLNALRLLRNKWSAVETPNTLTVKKENDVDTAWTAPLTTDSNAAPITGMDPT